MSKERLEECLHHIRGVLGLVGDQDTVNLAGELAELIDEQAERVQELRMFQKHTESLASVVADLEQQNKRYREVLERISKHDAYEIDIFVAGKMADEALEGDPHES